MRIFYSMILCIDHATTLRTNWTKFIINCVAYHFILDSLTEEIVTLVNPPNPYNIIRLLHQILTWNFNLGKSRTPMNFSNSNDKRGDNSQMA